jgi:hypothetical protein
MDAKDLRYIVFMIDPNDHQYPEGKKVDCHMGEVFCNLNDAREYAQDAIKEKFCTRFIIGLFLLDPNAERMGISDVESFGFRHDKKNVNQLQLFS